MKIYDVALSFAGENRPYVEKVADELKGLGVSVFYDEYEKINMWGKNLPELLINVYQKQARYVVMFISAAYKDKVWTRLEKQAAQARAVNESGEYILPVRFDDTELPGLLPTISYLLISEMAPTELAVHICDKIGFSIIRKKAHEITAPRSPSKSGHVTFNYSNNNGKYRLGEGVFEFETIWSKASDKTIYSYTDTPTIRGVALAPKGIDLKGIIDASSLDYTSRVRTAEIGRFVVLQNFKGFYAALQILEIADDSRGAPEDKLVFNYWILSEGGKDFSVIRE